MHKYFDVPDDLNKGEEAAEMDKVKKELFKVSKEIKRMVEAGENVKVNPKEVLEIIAEEEERARQPISPEVSKKKSRESRKSSGAQKD